MLNITNTVSVQKSMWFTTNARWYESLLKEIMCLNGQKLIIY